MLDLNAADWITVLAQRRKVKLRLKKGLLLALGKNHYFLGSICAYRLAHYCFKVVVMVCGGVGFAWNAAIQLGDHHNSLCLLQHGAFYRMVEITAHLFDLPVHQCLNVGLLPDWHLRPSVEKNSIHHLSVGVGNQAALRWKHLSLQPRKCNCLRVSWTYALTE